MYQRLFAPCVIMLSLVLACPCMAAGPAADGAQAAAKAAPTSDAAKKAPGKAAADKPAAASAKSSAASPANGQMEPAALVREAFSDDIDSEEDVIEQADAWTKVWNGQRTMLGDIRKAAAKFGENFATEATELTANLQPYENEARRLLLQAGGFRGWPNPLEAVNKRINAMLVDLRQLIAPFSQNLTAAQGHQARLINFIDSMPADNIQDSSLSDEMREYMRELVSTRLLLTAVMLQYDATLAAPQTLIARLEAARKEFDAQLSRLWVENYIHGPINYLSRQEWAHFGMGMRFLYHGIGLRLPVEIPVGAGNWSIAGVRFALSLLLAGLFSMVLWRKLVNRSSPLVVRHMFRSGVPLVCVGVALLVAGVSPSGDFYRVFQLVGNLLIILGQVSLAWDMRRYYHPGEKVVTAPFYRLIPLVFCAYLVLYMPMIKSLALVVWLALVAATLFWRKRSSVVDYAPLEFEPAVLEMEVSVLWLSLLLTLLGLHTVGMLLYMAFVALAIAIQLSMGGMMLMASASGASLKRKGFGGMMRGMLVTLSEPLVLVVAVLGLLLWVGTLPGGHHLLRDYVFTSVKVGNTNVNLAQVLLILSLFFVVRTVVGMGTHFIGELPRQNPQINASLVPPLQTVFTYALWVGFVLFVLTSLGLDLASLFMVAGGLSVGIGFGMQTIFNNFFSGLILIFSRTLQAGDVVEVGGITGIVRKISVRATMVETYDNALIYVPNSEFVSTRLINWTRNSRKVRRNINVGVAYGSDTQKVMQVLLEVAGQHDKVLKQPVPTVLFSDFAASTLDFVLRFWVDFDDAAVVASELRQAIEQRFREEGIEVAFPQMDIHVKELPAKA